MLINNANISGSLTINNASFNVTNGIMAGTSSFALTSSYSLAGSGFPYSGSAQITGSLLVSNLTGSGVRYVVTDGVGNITAQTASAAIKNAQAYTASAGQTTFAVTNGYTTGLVDVFINGSKLLKGTEYTDTSGTNIVLATGSFANDIVEVVTYQPASGVTNNSLRQLTSFTASAGQTTFSASYVPGLLDVYYNGSRLNTIEYTAADGVSINLATGSNAGDLIDVLVYSYQVGAFSGIGGTGVANQVAYWSTTNSITGSTNLTLSGSITTITGSLLISGSATALQINNNTLFVSSSGFVGMGATNSTIGSRLVVSGAIESLSAPAGEGGQLTLRGNTYQYGIDNYLGNTFRIFRENDGTGAGGVVLMNISASGNVGIGTTSPSASLEVSGSVFVGGNTSNSNYQFFVKRGTDRGMGIGLQGTDLSIEFVNDAVSTNVPTRIYANPLSILGGNVGIGATSPTFLLSVSQNASITIPTLDVSNAGTYGLIGVRRGTQTNASAGINYYTTTAQKWFTGIYENTDNFGFYNAISANFPLVITTSGSVLLGSTTSDSSNTRLQVAASGGSNWISGTFSGLGNTDKIVIGNLGGYGASIGGHNSTLTAWALMYINPGGGAVYAGTQRIDNNSDQRIKKNIQSIDNALDVVLSLKGRKFNMIDEDNVLRYGFVAQEVQPHLSDFVTESTREYKDENIHIENLLTLETSGAAWASLLVEALKEANAKIIALEEKLERNNII